MHSIYQCALNPLAMDAISLMGGHWRVILIWWAHWSLVSRSFIYCGVAPLSRNIKLHCTLSYRAVNKQESGQTHFCLGLIPFTVEVFEFGFLNMDLRGRMESCLIGKWGSLNLPIKSLLSTFQPSSRPLGTIQTSSTNISLVPKVQSLAGWFSCQPVLGFDPPSVGSLRTPYPIVQPRWLLSDIQIYIGRHDNGKF